MMQKIVIEFQARCDKCRTRAMEIAAFEPGVISVAIEGERKNQLAIEGDGVDPVRMVKLMRKKKIKLVNLKQVQPL